MSDNTQFTSIRQAVLDGVSELGVPEPAISRMVVLTRDGYCVGHRFPFDGIQAVWLTAGSVIRFFANDGALLRTVDVGQGPSIKKVA